MQHAVEEIVKEHTEFKSDDNEAKNFKAGKRADHDTLPEEIQALYVENLDLVHRMRELHLKLRTMSTTDSTCADSDRYPFLKEFIKLDKKLHDNGTFMTISWQRQKRQKVQKRQKRNLRRRKARRHETLGIDL